MEWKRKVEELRMPLLVAAGNQDWEECERLLEAGARFGHNGARARVEGAVYAFEHFIRHSQADLINKSLKIACEDNLSFYLLKASLTAEDVQSASSIVDYVFNFRAEIYPYVLSREGSRLIITALTEKWKHADLLLEKLPLMNPEIKKSGIYEDTRFDRRVDHCLYLKRLLVELASKQRWSACDTLIDWLQLKSPWLLTASIRPDIGLSPLSGPSRPCRNVMDFFWNAKQEALIIKILPYYDLTSSIENKKFIFWLCNRGNIDGLHGIINSSEPTQGDEEGFGYALNFLASKQNWPMCYQLLEMSHISMKHQSLWGSAIEHFSDYGQYDLMLKAIQKVDLSSSINGLPVLYQIMKKPRFINIVKYLMSIHKDTADDAEGFGLALLIFAKNKDWPMCQHLLTMPNISLDWCYFNVTEGFTYAVQYFYRYEQVGLIAATNANPKWKVSSEKIQTLNLMPIPKADAQLGSHFSRPSYLKIDPSPGRRDDAALVNDIFHPILMLMGELKDEVVSGNKEKCEALLVKITEARDNKHELNHHKTAFLLRQFVLHFIRYLKIDTSKFYQLSNHRSRTLKSLSRNDYSLDMINVLFRPLLTGLVGDFSANLSEWPIYGVQANLHLLLPLCSPSIAAKQAPNLFRYMPSRDVKQEAGMLLTRRHGFSNTELVYLLNETWCKKDCSTRRVGIIRPPRRAHAKLIVNPSFLPTMMSSTDKEASTRGPASHEFKMELAAHAHLRNMNLFSNPNNPFKVMQEYICKMDQVVRRLSLNGGSILGNFKPVTNPVQCPLPLFIDPDGNLLGCFLHGTSEQGVEGISKTNFSESKSAKNGRLYGPGTYFTPTACKAFQYTGQGSSRELLLSAVFLGRPYYPSGKGGIPADLSKYYDSVIALPRFAWAGRQAHFEIVVPNNSKEPRVFPLLNITAHDSLEIKDLQESVNMCHTM